ncbi:MAG: hypothetical protein FJX64_02410 [Alphaproteobacteria bacterium]|nr:hypothetical protein [Alphaproteobacteria bacterium]
MNLFRSYTFTWWQIGVLKLALLGIGVLVGAAWHELFTANTAAIAAATAYIVLVSLRQVRPHP